MVSTFHIANVHWYSLAKFKQVFNFLLQGLPLILFNFNFLKVYLKLIGKNTSFVILLFVLLFFWTKNVLFSFSLEMPCCNCFKNDAEAFEKATCVFDSRRSLVLFLLNVLLNIEEIWEKYCFCEKCVIPCLVCQFRIAYIHDEYDIYEN